MVTQQLFKYFKFLVTGPKFSGDLFGGGGGDEPEAPDPGETASAQLKLNKGTAAYNAKLDRYKQLNPLGTVSWLNSGTDNDPNWTQTTTLSPAQQAIYNKQLGVQNKLGLGADRYATNLNRAMYTAPSGGDNAARARAESALMARLNPYLKRDQDALTTQLANQGLTYGGDAYTKAMLDQSARTNDARLAVIAQAGDEMARQQQMEQVKRDQAMQEMGFYQGGMGNVTMPSYSGGTQIGGIQSPDIAGLINSKYQSELAAANAGQAGKNSLMGGGMGALGSIGGSLISKFSDIRLKENIVPVGEKNGFKLYEFNYIGDPQRYKGVIAQEVAMINPKAVHANAEGILSVDYSKLGFDMEAA